MIDRCPAGNRAAHYCFIGWFHRQPAELASLIPCVGSCGAFACRRTPRRPASPRRPSGPARSAPTRSVCRSLRISLQSALCATCGAPVNWVLLPVPRVSCATVACVSVCPKTVLNPLIDSILPRSCFLDPQNAIAAASCTMCAGPRPPQFNVEAAGAAAPAKAAEVTACPRTARACVGL